MAKKSPLVSICILSWDTLSETKACLKSVRALNYNPKQIIIVDNGSTDGSKKYLQQQTDITYVDLPRNEGFTGGQLVAFEKAGGAYILLINSDAVIDKNWLGKAMPIMEEHPSIGALGGRAYTWRDHERPYDTSNDFYTYQIIDGRRGYARTLMAGEARTAVDAISGAGVLIRRSAIEKTGYFDNRFFAYFEETDLFARMQRAGYEIIYEPALHMWHKVAQSTKDKPYFYLYHMHRNRFLFAVKNFDRGPALGFFCFYTLDGLRALGRYARHHDLDSKARYKSLGWNLLHLLPTFTSRRRTQSLGSTYNGILLKRRATDDITVIIPCYNYEAYVGKAIECSLRQTLKPRRILVINDGSTDKSAAVIKNYVHDGVDFIDKPNEGVVATKNLGIRQSSTTWTVFLDADDTIRKDYLETLYKEAVSRHSDVVYTDMRYFGARSGIIRGGRFNMKRLLVGNFIHNSALISTSFLKEIGGYKAEMNDGYEDWELYITLAEAGARFSYVPKALLNYRQHHTSNSRNEAAIETAHRLRETVHKLHANTYKQHAGFRYKCRRAFYEIVHNPLLVVLAVLLIPVGLVYGIRGFIGSFKGKILHYLRVYAERRHAYSENENMPGESPDEP